jgi:signal peptidase I
MESRDDSARPEEMSPPLGPVPSPLGPVHSPLGPVPSPLGPPEGTVGTVGAAAGTVGTAAGTVGAAAGTVGAAAGTVGAAAPAEPPAPPASAGKGRARSLLRSLFAGAVFFEVAVVVLLALFSALLLKVYVAEAYEIRGKSMEDTFHQDERVMVLKVLYEIRRGDIIIFASSENPRKDLIKRVIGLPGDRVEVRDGDVFVNGEKLEEPYARRTTRPERFVERVKPGKYFVLGDNRPDSQDSRVFHAIDAASIKGKVVLRWWPLGKFDSF